MEKQTNAVVKKKEAPVASLDIASLENLAGFRNRECRSERHCITVFKNSVSTITASNCR
jgi:hypothetical protein